MEERAGYTWENGRKVFDVVAELEAARDQWCTSGFGVLCQRAADEITTLRAEAERRAVLLRDIAEFWAGGDCPPELWARLRGYLS